MDFVTTAHPGHGFDGAAGAAPGGSTPASRAATPEWLVTDAKGCCQCLQNTPGRGRRSRNCYTRTETTPLVRERLHWPREELRRTGPLTVPVVALRNLVQAILGVCETTLLTVSRQVAPRTRRIPAQQQIWGASRTCYHAGKRYAACTAVSAKHGQCHRWMQCHSGDFGVPLLLRFKIPC